MVKRLYGIWSSIPECESLQWVYRAIHRNFDGIRRERESQHQRPFPVKGGTRCQKREGWTRKDCTATTKASQANGRIDKHLIVGTIHGSAITSQPFISPSDNTLPALMSFTHRDFGNVTTIRWQRSSKDGTTASEKCWLHLICWRTHRPPEQYQQD